MSDLNIRNNQHQGIEFDVQGTNLVATVTPELVGAAPLSHSHTIPDVDGLQDALNAKQDIGGDFDERYLRVDDLHGLSPSSQGYGRTNLGLGTAAVLNAPVVGDAGATEVVLGNDSRLGGGGGGSGTGAVEVNLGNMSGTSTVGLDGNKVVHAYGTLVGNATLAFSNVPGDGVTVVTLAVTQDATGSRTLTLPVGTVVLNGGDGSINPTPNATTWLTFVRRPSVWQVSISDARATDFDEFYLNPPGNGDYRVGFRKTRILDFSDVEVIGGASVAFHRSTDGGSSWGSALSGTTTFDRGDLLRCTVTGFDSFCTITIPRVG